MSIQKICQLFLPAAALFPISWHYLLIFIGAFLVDLIPIIGPPAWTVMVFFQMQYDVNLWLLLIAGVSGSMLGRYSLSKYMPLLSGKFLRQDKNEDIEFIGHKLNKGGKGIQLFVFLYTLMPLPSTPLFTAAGIAKVRSINILPAFFVGKFLSDMAMVITGKYMVTNREQLTEILLTWDHIALILVGVIVLFIFLFIDWHQLLLRKKFRLNFRIWK
ncbi:MAG: hypothetical protein ABI581_13975 [Sediminibacterium sp.]